jgi:DNA helicase-2/ATP-dependent DNA helicase PcrA
VAKVHDVDAERLLDGLNEAQARAVQTSVVPLCILAGAGSGKTRVLTRRIAYRAATGQHDPERVLALTFTRKAAGELTQRLRALGLRDSVVAGTFHAVAYAQLRARWAERNISPPALLDRKVGFVARLLPARSTAVRAGRSPRPGRDTLALDVTAEIEWAKARRVSAEHYPSAAKAAGRTPPLEPREIAALIDAYEAEKKKKRMVDFDDLLSLCVRDVENDSTAAAAQRWRFRHFFVDEYQDVNPLQQSLLDAWLGDRTDLCVVGDPNQAIYAWNGADARYLSEFTQRWQRGEVVRLSENYRSSPQVLAVANAVLAGGLGAQRSSKGAPTDQAALRANRPSGPIPTVRMLADERSEAVAIARAVRDHHAPGAPWSAQAILVRTNAQTAVLEAALKNAQIPFRVKGGSSLLEQPEVQQALRDLRSARNDFAVALTDLETTAARAGRLVPGAAGAVTGAEDEDVTELSSRGTAADAERLANLQALVGLAHDYAAIDVKPTVSGFTTWLKNTTRADQPDRQGDAVDIATFHAAKGLEWPIVHLAGLEQGYVPIGHAQTPVELAEERRLFYVAATRAERELRCTWAASRTFGTKVVARDRSPYLAQVVAACEALERDEVPEDWAAHFRAARAKGHAAAPERVEALQLRGLEPGGAEPHGPDGPLAPDEPVGPAAARAQARAATPAPGRLTPATDDEVALVTALARWRASVAKGAAITPLAVMHDATLRAVARARPATTDELTKIDGLGPVKAQRYGDAILAIVADHAATPAP